MGKKKALYHLGIRLGILILLLIDVFIFRKADSFELHFFLIQTYCIFLLLEMIYFFCQEKQQFSLNKSRFFNCNRNNTSFTFYKINGIDLK
jgi:hypothetical protein